jgi:hypothetical protein
MRLLLTPDDFTCQGESAVTQSVIWHILTSPVVEACQIAKFPKYIKLLPNYIYLYTLAPTLRSQNTPVQLHLISKLSQKMFQD